MAVSPDGWRALLQQLRSKQPASQDQYVPPVRGCVEEVVTLLTADPASREKVLLVGARGGGKSSELRAVARALETRGGALLATVDLDASGVHAPNVTAFDLLYLSALGVLQGMATEQARPLLDRLNSAYAGEQAPELQNNLGKLSGFALAGAGLAAAGGAYAKLQGIDIDAPAALAGGALSTLGSALGTGGGLVLRDRSPAVVGETSTMGRALIEACIEIARARRRASADPLYLLVDGLEKMNGEANERFRQIFEQTRLVADAPWATIIAAPPCTLTETNAVMAVGYCPVTVWGFGPDDRNGLLRLVKQRFRGAGVDPAEAAAPGVIEHIVDSSGSLPRHTVDIVWNAVLEALRRGAGQLTMEDAERALQKYGEMLATGLTREDLAILADVHRTGLLPGRPRAAVLFADNRILSYPPAPGTRLPIWAVHPLLAPDVEKIAAQVKKSTDEKP